MLLLGWVVLAVCTPAGAQPSLSDQALLEALRRGGHTIYFRHAATDWRQEDKVVRKGDWTSCDPRRMRQLAPEGRAVAARIGRAIRSLGIPVSGVFASEYCRTQETARLLGLGPVTATLDVMNLRAAEFVGGRAAVVARARRTLATPPRHGANRVFVAHGNLLRAVSGVYTGEAGAVVFRPSGVGRLERLAELAPEDWERLAHKYGRRSE